METLTDIQATVLDWLVVFSGAIVIAGLGLIVLTAIERRRRNPSTPVHFPYGIGAFVVVLGVAGGLIVLFLR
ncbi:hypothetical protein AB0K08_16140 [Citricoccus sp. NPDC055426]|uniref:hypothetical protein n=1 Tax=Citricoccus sp. NPDC055426 TaxID=3155536 RepID=UPI00341CF36E